MTSARIAPVLGLASWLLILTGFVVHGYPAMGASGQDLGRWASVTETGRFVTGVFVEHIGLGLFLVFLAWLAYQLLQAGGSPWLLALGLGSAAVWMGVGLTVNAVWSAILEAGKREADPQLLAAMRDVAQYAYNSTNITFGLAMAAIGLAAVSARQLPRWIGWAAIAIGIGVALTANLPNVNGPIGLLSLFWTVAVASKYLYRPPRPVTTATS
jgi:Domain of unknown function (DUF4386)